MKLFGNIPEEVLGLEIESIEGEYPTLAFMIQEETKEPVLHAKYMVSTTSFKSLRLESFTAWTKTQILKLIWTNEGAYLLTLDRDYDKLENMETISDEKH